MGRDDLDVVVAGVRDLVAMPSAGDLVIYGHASHVSFIPEQSAPAGPSREELHTFIIHPDRVRLPAPIVHPVQLYPGVRLSGASAPLTLAASRDGRRLL